MLLQRYWDNHMAQCQWSNPREYWYINSFPLVLHICIAELGQPWFRLWFGACSAPSHYLNQCWLIVNWTLRNKLQWNLNQITKLFIHENAFENVVWKMAAILSGPQCVNPPGADVMTRTKTKHNIPVSISYGMYCICESQLILWVDPESKVHGASMGPIWVQQDPGGPHVGPMNFAILVSLPSSWLLQDLFWHFLCKLLSTQWCHGNIIHITGPLWRESTNYHWEIPLIKGHTRMWSFDDFLQSPDSPHMQKVLP